MKLLYCIHSIYNPGGMERVLLNKTIWLQKRKGWEIVIVTTDQCGRPPFFPMPESIRHIDLGVNYSADKGKGTLAKIFGYLYRRYRHRKALTTLLNVEKPDITISLLPCESSFIPDIKDGSRKVLELHFNKNFRIQYGRRGLVGLIDRWRTMQDEKMAGRFDKFIVLTREDKENWGGLPNIEMIPNAALFPEVRSLSNVSATRVIAVGRLDYQKGFDRLILAWEQVQKRNEFASWQLDIYGQGEWQGYLQGMINEKGLSTSVCINKPSSTIWEEYSRSSLLVMSSNYEGFGMVLVEAMACGVPVVSFDCPCGPKDIIDDGVNGLLVKNGDIDGLAEAMMRIMRDKVFRQRLGRQAIKITEKYSQERIMGQWVNLFEGLVGDCHDRCALS